MKIWLKLVCAGWLLSSATRSLYEDMLGKEAFILRVETGWISEWITVPIALVMIIWALGIIESNKGQ